MILAVDGGNAKTDLALVANDGRLCALVRGPGSSPHAHGVEGALDRIAGLIAQTGAELPVAIAELLLAGVDFPGEERTIRAAAEARGWARQIEVGNDTFAVLRAGTDRGWGVAVVCGAGINCLGVAPDGRHARFPALGEITGDWGGGYDVGRAAVSAAARSEDGRGPRTSLERTVPAHFGLETPLQLAEAVHTGAIAQRRFVELAPLVLGEAADDAVAAELVARLAGEVIALVRVALERIGPVEETPDIVLGGGLLQARDERLLAAIDVGLADLGVPHSLMVVETPPVVGAALHALDALGARPEAHVRLRNDFTAEERFAEASYG
jgi:N-acetylglucosamine kinase-like BadF-type ATPase